MTQGNFSKLKRGLDKGTLYHLFFFNLAIDVLSILINRAKASGQFHGVVPHLAKHGQSILQYVDDTILLLDHNFEEAKNLKLLLSTFEGLSSLKINFHKSEIFLWGDNEL